jgi:hypothetical protein
VINLVYGTCLWKTSLLITLQRAHGHDLHQQANKETKKERLEKTKKEKQ